MTEKPKKFFVGIPKEFFLKSPKRFFLERTEIFFREIQKEISEKNKKIFQDNPKVKYIRPSKINFSKFEQKKVAKHTDPTRVNRVELSNKDKIRNMLETQAHFPYEPSFLEILRKTILDYFLPYPPAPPLDDKRNVLPDHRENKNGSQE